MSNDNWSICRVEDQIEQDSKVNLLEGKLIKLKKIIREALEDAAVYGDDAGIANLKVDWQDFLEFDDK
jgi:hypothetical protein